MTPPWPTEHMEWLAALGRATADLTLGRCCAGCDRPGIHLCAECAHQLRPVVRMHSRLHLDEVAPGVGIPILVPWDYSGVRRQVVYRFKDHGDFSVTHHLVDALATVLREVLGVIEPAPSVAIPIPGRRAATRARGFNPVLHLLTSATTRVHHPLRIESHLVDSRIGRGNKRLGSVDRRAAVAGAFSVRGRIPRSPIVLVDDVVTTGSTLREAAVTLMHSGVEVVAAVAVAGTQLGYVGDAALTRPCQPAPALS